MKTETSTHEQDEFTLEEKIKYGILGILVIGGSFFIGRSIVRKARANTEEKKTFEDGSPAAYAKQLKMAFENDGWWGTDEEAIRKVARAIQSKDEFKSVIDSYEKLYSSSLMRDMKDELQASEFNEILAIIAAKPDKYLQGQLPVVSTIQYQSWAKRLKAAFEISYGPFPGTDEPAIKAVFLEIPTQAVFDEVKKAYQVMYGNDLIKELQSELELWEYGPMMTIINKKPKA